MPWTTVTHSGRHQRLPPARPCGVEYMRACYAMDDRHGKRPRSEINPCARPILSRMVTPAMYCESYTHVLSMACYAGV
eukprot:3807846-Pyramimonas_sp.AAC.1